VSCFVVVSLISALVHASGTGDPAGMPVAPGAKSAPREQPAAHATEFVGTADTNPPWSASTSSDAWLTSERACAPCKLSEALSRILVDNIHTGAMCIVPPTIDSALGPAIGSGMLRRAPIAAAGRMADNPQLVIAPCVNVLDYIPNQLHASIILRTNSILLHSYLQDALDKGAGGNVVFPPGTYVVDGAMPFEHRNGPGGALQVRSNTRVILMPGAIVKQQTTGAEVYRIFNVSATTSNVIFTGGGTLQGDRATHVYGDGHPVSRFSERTHEFGVCLMINGPASHITIEHITVRDATGDGITIDSQGGYPALQLPATKVHIRKVTSTNNRRQGMSILAARDLVVENSTFENTGGTPPSAGIDVEPGGGGRCVQNAVFSDNAYRGNAGRGIVLQGSAAYDDVINVSIVGGVAARNRYEGITAFRVRGGASISSVLVSENGDSGIFALSSKHLSISDNTVVRNSQTGDARRSGIVIAKSDDVSVTGNIVRHGGGPKRHKYGLLLTECVNTYVAGNDLRDSARDSANAFGSERSSTVAFTSNQGTTGARDDGDNHAP
jgi:hypothetical protein